MRQNLDLKVIDHQRIPVLLPFLLTYKVPLSELPACIQKKNIFHLISESTEREGSEANYIKSYCISNTTILKLNKNPLVNSKTLVFVFQDFNNL